jgi:hypothetical protein
MVRILENSILWFQGENRLIFILIVLVYVFNRKFLLWLFNENNFYYVKYAFLGRSFYDSLICYF